MTLVFLIAAPAKAAAEEGTPWWVFALIAGGVVIFGTLFLMLAMRKPKPTERPCPSCGRVMLAEWKTCKFCGNAAPAASSGNGSAASDGPSELKVVSGPLQGQTISLARDVTTIGTAEGNSVMLSDTGVSRKHCGIRRVEDGGYELADLGSTNGVYVNGEKVARRKLSPGDVIRVGTTEMVFRA
jgi:hypothetical protein